MAGKRAGSRPAGGDRRSRPTVATHIRGDPLMNWLIWIIAAGALAVIYGVVQTSMLLRLPAGNERMQEIAAAIQEGASAYLRRQYTTIGAVGIVILLILLWLLGPLPAIGFLIGAVLSGAAGFCGMLISVRANVRTDQAASES